MEYFGRGFKYFYSGFGYLLVPGIRRFVLAPVLINALLYAVLMWFLVSRFGDLVAAAEESLPAWLDWLGAVLWILFVAAAFFLLLFTYVAVGSLVAAPFNGMLAEAVEHHLTGSRPPDLPWPRMIARLPHTIRQETMKLFYFLFWTVVILISFIVPLVNLLSPVLWALFTAWMCALDFSDYAMDNNRLPFREMRRRLRGDLSMSLGFGFGMMLVLGIPVVNILALPAAVIGATIMWVDHFRHVPPPGHGPVGYPPSA